MATVAEVLREQYSELYKTLVKADTSRRLVATDLYSKNIITEHEHDKIKEVEKLHGADESTEEILKRIKTHLGVFPTKISKVLEVLGREELLKPIAMAMEAKLPHPRAHPSVQTPSEASPPPPLVSTESRVGQKGIELYPVFA